MVPLERAAHRLYPVQACEGWVELMVPDEISRRLALVQEEHRDLDLAIDALRTTPGSDQLLLARLKRRKLRFRDEIAMLQDMRIPDIIA